MTTALNIITKAMQKAGIITKNEVPDSDEANDALDALNDMLASWSNDSLLIIARVTENFPLNANQGIYTIGAGQDFNTIRPIKIIESHVRQGTIDYPSMYLAPDEIYQNIALKTVTGIPELLNYTNQYPYGTIKLYPLPVPGYSIFITSEKELVQFASLNEVLSLPPGWNRALVYNLGVELCPEYGQEPAPSLVKIAADSKGQLSKAIMRVRTMDAPPLNEVGRFNIWSGYYQQ